MKNQFKSFIILFSIIIIWLPLSLNAQTFDDGPIELQVRVVDFNVTYHPPQDWSLNLGGTVGFDPDELTFFIWTRDNANISGLGWQGGNCLQADYDPPGPTPNLSPSPYLMFNHTYAGTTVPEFFDLRLDAWQDNCGSDGAIGFNCPGSRCSYETNCCCLSLPFIGCTINTSDNTRCNANPFLENIPYRSGNPCEWHSHGFMAGNCPNNNHYLPHIESFWRYTKGENCTDPIALGTLLSGDTISHFNSNVCYNNTFGTPGKDVIYSFEITEPMGVRVAACGGSGAYNRTIYLNDGTCSSNTLASASGSCAQLSYSICLPGTYHVIISGTDATGEGTFTLELFEDTDFTYQATIEKTDITCHGANDGIAAVVVNGGMSPFTYQWTPGGSTDSVLTNIGEGTIEVEVTDSDNCVVTATATFTDPDPIVIDSIIPLDVSCGGATDGEALVYVQGGTPAYSYLWSTFPIQQVTNPAVFLPTGNYMVTVTDQNGCQASESVVISSASPISINVVDFADVSCFGNQDGFIEVEITGGEEPYIYSWSNGSETNYAANLEPGQVDFVLIDGDGCIEEASYIISEPTLLQSNILSVVDVTCAGGNDGVAGVIGFGGTPPYNYEWQPGGNNLELLVNATAADYQITVTDANGCETIDSVLINEPAPIQTSISGFDPDCTAENRDNASISLDVSGGSGNLDILWSNGSNVMDLFNIPGGNYIVFIHDEEDCFAIDSIKLEVCSPDTILVPEGELHFVRVPNAFAPDGSGQNAYFNVKAMNAHSIEMRIFNRWGEEVYHHHNLLISSNGWDGTHKGSKAPMGSYVYHLKVEYINGIVREKTGNVALIR